MLSFRIKKRAYEIESQALYIFYETLFTAQNPGQRLKNLQYQSVHHHSDHIAHRSLRDQLSNQNKTEFEKGKTTLSKSEYIMLVR